jgi:undecaprenyl-diphosphatase
MDESIVQAVVLAIVQGLTEFVPISSSGHLVIVPWFLGWEKPSLLFDTVLHWGTLLSIFLVFGRDLWSIALATVRSLLSRSLTDSNARMGWFIVVGTVPAVVSGLLWKDFFEALFGSPAATGGFLLVTALLLTVSEWVVRRSPPSGTLEELTWRQAILIGCAQAVALAPGISRSGSTIAAGLGLGLRREDAARFSFLLGAPAFFGAGLLQLLDALTVDAAEVAAQVPMLVVGLVVSAIVGYAAIRGLLAYLRRRSLYLFAAYCLVMGLVVLGLSLLG